MNNYPNQQPTPPQVQWTKKKVTITDVQYVYNNKDGQPYVGKFGAFAICRITTTTDKQASCIFNPQKQPPVGNADVGREIELEFSKSGDFWNFRKPKVDVFEVIRKLEDRVATLERIVCRPTEGGTVSTPFPPKQNTTESQHEPTTQSNQNIPTQNWDAEYEIMKKRQAEEGEIDPEEIEF